MHQMSGLYLALEIPCIQTIDVPSSASLGKGLFVFRHWLVTLWRSNTLEISLMKAGIGKVLVMNYEGEIA